MSAVLHGMRHEGTQRVAHLAHAIPAEDPAATDHRGVARWPSGEHRYLCGRQAQDIHTVVYRWKPSDEYPVCKQCLAAQAEV